MQHVSLLFLLAPAEDLDAALDVIKARIALRDSASASAVSAPLECAEASEPVGSSPSVDAPSILPLSNLTPYVPGSTKEPLDLSRCSACSEPASVLFVAFGAVHCGACVFLFANSRPENGASTYVKLVKGIDLKGPRTWSLFSKYRVRDLPSVFPCVCSKPDCVSTTGGLCPLAAPPLLRQKKSQPSYRRSGSQSPYPAFPSPFYHSGFTSVPPLPSAPSLYPPYRRR